MTGNINNNKGLGKGLSTTILILHHLYHCNNNNITTLTTTTPHTYKAYIIFGKNASPAKSTTTNTHKNSTSYVQ